MVTPQDTPQDTNQEKGREKDGIIVNMILEYCREAWYIQEIRELSLRNIIVSEAPYGKKEPLT